MRVETKASGMCIRSVVGLLSAVGRCGSARLARGGRSGGNPRAPRTSRIAIAPLVSTEWHCDQWEIFFGLPSGPLLTVLNEHMWQHLD